MNIELKWNTRLTRSQISPSDVRLPGIYDQPRRSYGKAADYGKSIDKLSHVWSSRTSNLVVDKAKGSWMWDTDGNKYLDFTCGIAVTNTGHCHPKVVKAIQEQAGTLFHGQANIVYHKPMLELVERLQKIVKVTDNDRYFFSNSGAEAIEGAIKLARQVTHKPNIIAFQHSFHGRTIGTMSLSNSKYIYRIGFQPLMAGTFCTPYPYCLHCDNKGKGAAGKDCCGYPMEQLELLVRQQTHPDEVAAVIVEPIPGEGGYIVPPNSFLKNLREFCDKNKILLILDEVQTGFGRTGKWFAFEHFGIRPDILVMAKGIASGLPLSGIVASNDLMGKWKPGSHGGTYGGNAVSCAAACATIDAMIEENMLQNANERGKQLMDGLRQLQKKHKQITDVRGLGLMVGLELDHKTNPGVAGKLTKACLDNKMLLLSAGAFETLRFIPPLNVTKEEIDIGLKTFSKVCEDVLGK